MRRGIEEVGYPMDTQRPESLMRIHRFDPEHFPFRSLVSQALETMDLALLHEKIPAASPYGVFNARTDQTTIFHRQVYESMNRGLLDTYIRFVFDYIAPLIPERHFLYQRVPTFRVHLPDNLAVGEFHRDSDYSHPDGETTFWLPLTRAFGSCTIIVESLPGLGDLHPVELDYGQVLQFDSVNCRHGNRMNTTGRTRVSFDFRVLPYSKYNPDNELASADQKLKFRIGGYYLEHRPD